MNMLQINNAVRTTVPSLKPQVHKKHGDFSFQFVVIPFFHSSSNVIFALENAKFRSKRSN